MFSKKFLRSAARVMAVCFLLVNCFAALPLVTAAEKITVTLEAVNLFDSVPKSLYFGSYNQIYQFGSTGNYLGLVSSDRGASYLVTSTDQLTWTVVTDARELIFGDNCVIGTAIPMDASDILYSPDGLNWSIIPELHSTTIFWNTGRNFRNGTFFLDSAGDRNLRFSPNGLDWFKMDDDLPPTGLNAFTKLQDNYVVIGSSNTGELEVYSAAVINENPTAWIPAVIPGDCNWYQTNGDNSLWISTRDAIYYRTTDGINWDQKTREEFTNIPFSPGAAQGNSGLEAVTEPIGYFIHTTGMDTGSTVLPTKFMWNGAEVKAPVLLEDGERNKPFSYTVQTNEANAVFSMADAGELPAGLEINPATGEIYGTPQTIGWFDFTVFVDCANPFYISYQLYIGNDSTSNPDTMRPANWGKNTSPTIAVGVGSSFAVKDDGSLWAWGNNDRGQLGDGTTTNRATPVKVMDDVVSVYARGNAFALKTDGSLWAWGWNKYGQVGDGTTTDRHSPVKIMDGVAYVSAAGRETFAIKTDGSLWAWGNNRVGQLGDGTTTDRHVPVKIMENVIYISMGMSCLAAVTADGSLWMWGGNYSGQLGDGTTTNRHSPVKIMDGVTSVSAGYGYTMAVKNDGSLWAWGSNDFGQLGDGTLNGSYTPKKVMDGVVSVCADNHSTFIIQDDGSLWACGSNDMGELGDGTTTNRYSPVKIMDGYVVAINTWNHTMAVKADGSLWIWGSNSNGEYGDGTTVSQYTPKKVMDGVKLPSEIELQPMIPAPASPAPKSVTTDAVPIGPSRASYTDPASNLSISLDPSKLAGVYNQTTAVMAINDMASALTTEQRQSTTGIDLMTLFAEEAVAQAARNTTNGNKLTINQNAVQNLQSQSITVRSAAENTLTSNGIITQREMNADVKFRMSSVMNMTVIVQPSAANTTADHVRIETTYCGISIPNNAIKEMTANGDFVITITESSQIKSAALMSGPSSLSAANNPTSFDVSFNKPVSDNVKISITPRAGDPTYQAIVNSDGEAVGGKYNPATYKLEAQINSSDTYTVKENKKDFTDIAGKSQEMQTAIRVLASKGIINGATATTFNPDGTMTRAEIAAIIMSTISKLDPNANGNFSDVSRSDWYFGAVGSARRHGIVEGSGGRFNPRGIMTKDQIITISARTLKSEMKYKTPVNADSLLSVYNDKNVIPSWGADDIALATRENLVVKRSDGSFNPNGTMTRGDAAMVLYRLFLKMW